MHIFYCATAPEITVLDETESQHAIKVLRLAEGNEIEITNGKGGWYKATISKGHFKKCEFVITETVQLSKANEAYLHIAIAPTKNNDRIEWFIEKCVEIGIDEISFIQCNHSERKNLNLERATKVAVSAMKQSQKAYLPKINELISFKQFVGKEPNIGQKFIAYVSTEPAENAHLFKAAEKNTAITILIGPEGDFSKTEIEMAFANKYVAVSLGESRLRTETAGVAACLALNLLQL